MKIIITLTALLLSNFVYAQNTEVRVNANNIGINITSPASYFHIEIPESSIYDGLYVRTNHTGPEDRKAIEGYSICSPGYGIGGNFTGGYYGIYSHGAGTSSTSAPTCGIYTVATGSAGTRIGLYSSAFGGDVNLAARFGNGDVEIQNKVTINTSDQQARLSIANNELHGGNATAIKIVSNLDGPQSSYGTLVTATNGGSGNTYGHYATVSTQGTGTAFAFRGIANNDKDWAFYGTGNSYFSGDVRVGTTSDPYTGQYKLIVNGRILSEEVRVQNSDDWPDYVFKEGYKLKTLSEVESYIEKYQHLPNIPPAAVVEREGIALGDMQIRLMEKVEELTLYLIAQQKEIDNLKNQIKRLSNEK